MWGRHFRYEQVDAEAQPEGDTEYLLDQGSRVQIPPSRSAANKWKVTDGGLFVPLTTSADRVIL